MRHPQIAAHWHSHSNHLVYLSVADEPALLSLLNAFERNGLACAEFLEPDLDQALTAVVVEPSSRVRKLCRGLPLALKEYLSLAPIQPFNSTKT